MFIYRRELKYVPAGLYPDLKVHVHSTKFTKNYYITLLQLTEYYTEDEKVSTKLRQI